MRLRAVLDIYGFESFTSGNGLEQLCINWANEKQQQLFVNQVIREEVELFAQQGIAVPAKKSLVSKHFSPEEQAQQKLELRRQNVRSAVGQFRVSIQRSLIDALPNTASLLQQLQQGVFHRLDDSCRLLAQGQNRTDAQFWSDVFAACCATKSPSQASSGNDSLGKVEPHVLFCLKGAQGNRAVEAASRGELLHILEAEQLAALGLLPPNAMASGLGKPVGKALPSSGTKTLAAGGFASAANKAREGLFAVQHFAGTVLYRTEGWIERNNDSVGCEASQTLRRQQSVNSPFLAQSVCVWFCLFCRLWNFVGGGESGGFVGNLRGEDAEGSARAETARDARARRGGVQSQQPTEPLFLLDETLSAEREGFASAVARPEYAPPLHSLFRAEREDGSRPL